MSTTIPAITSFWTMIRTVPGGWEARQPPLG